MSCQSKNFEAILKVKTSIDVIVKAEILNPGALASQKREDLLKEIIKCKNQ